MRFFEKQKVDEIGMVSVSLQKILIFLMIVNAFSAFNGGLLGFILCIICFIGALKRKPGLLLTYAVVSIAFMALIAIYMISFLFFGFATPAMEGSDGNMYINESSSSSSSSFDIGRINRSIPAVMRRFLSSSNATSSDSSSAAYSNSVSSGSCDPDMGCDADWMSLEWLFLIGLLFIMLSIFLLMMKISSISLALRLRKMLLAPPVLPIEYREEAHDNSCAMPEENMHNAIPMTLPPQSHPFFNQGFMPYSPMPMPNMQYPGAPSMVPPPMMYGQYPVYYSFAPIPQAPPASNPEDKL